MFAAFSFGLLPLFALAAPQEAAFTSLDGTALKAWVFQPAAQLHKGTVIALHGCGGLYASRGVRTGQLNPRHQAMADLLVSQAAAGIATPSGRRPRPDRRARRDGG